MITRRPLLSVILFPLLALFLLPAFGQQPFPTHCAGTYRGLVGRILGTDSGLGGVINVSVNRSGHVTGFVDVGTRRYPFTGRVTHTTGSYYVLKKVIGYGWMDLQVIIDCDKAEVTGSVSIATGDWTLMFYGRKLQPTTTNWVPHNWRGTHYVTLTPQIETDKFDEKTFPIGQGLGKVVISANGTYVWTGKLADGSRYRFAGRLEHDGRFSGRTLLYGGKGSLQGWFYLSGDAGYIYGEAEWIKYPKPGAATFPNGFPLHKLTVTEG
jgi:hypothetical protein